MAGLKDLISQSLSETDIRVLIYHETNGFRHASMDAGIEMIEEFGQQHGWTVKESLSSSIFNESNLAAADVVVWLNTSGNGPLTADEQSVFEQFIQNGGGFVGVHAATDTYRDGSRPWYNDLVGATVQANRDHTADNFNATMDAVGSHPAAAHLGIEWNKDEEYYYREINGGYLYEGNIQLLRVQSTGSEVYDVPRPITWYKNYDGGRSFYTALGHNSSDYSEEDDFRNLVQQAILRASELIDNPLETMETDGVHTILAYPNPTAERLTIRSRHKGIMEIKLLSITGQVLMGAKGIESTEMDLRELRAGVYILLIELNGELVQRKIMKQ